jgi:hypothetical protein
MNSLARLEHENLELFVNESTGEVFASQASIARMTQKARSTISDWAKGVRDEYLIDAEIPTNGGVQGVRLFTEDAIFDAFSRYAPDLLVQCAKAGIRVYLHRMAGYSVSVAKPKTHLEILADMAQALVAQEQVMLKMQLEQQMQSEKIAEIEAITHQHDGEIDRIFNPNGHYFSVMGYFSKFLKISISIKKASAIGKRCSQYCRANNIPIEPLTDPRFGSVNSYPEHVIEMFC